jgi:hypothetical protein
MKRRWALALAGIVAALAIPAPASADMCGGVSSVTPTAGPIGTTFVFRTNLGAPSDLYLYQEGVLRRTASLDGSGYVSYRLRTGPGDGGHWIARAETRGFSECFTESAFTVTDAPDTSTIGSVVPPPGGGGVQAFLLMLAAISGLIVGLVRTRRRGGRFRAAGRPGG